MTNRRSISFLLFAAALALPRTVWSQTVSRGSDDDFYDDIKSVEAAAQASAKEAEREKRESKTTGVFREERCGWSDCLYEKYCYYDSRGDLDHWVLRDHGQSVTAYVTIYKRQVQYNSWVDSNRSHQWVGSAMIDPRVCLKGNGQWCDQYRYNPDFDIIPFSKDAYGTIDVETLLIPYYEALPRYQVLSDHYKSDQKADTNSPENGQNANPGLQVRRTAITEAGMRMREFEQLAQKAKPLEQEWCGGKFQIDPEQLPKGYMGELAKKPSDFQQALEEAGQLEKVYQDGLLH